MKIIFEKARLRWGHHFMRNEAFICIFISGMLYLFVFVNVPLCENVNNIVNNLSNSLSSIAATILGFIITGLSIIISLGDTGRIMYMKKMGVYNKILPIYIMTIIYLAFLTLYSLSIDIFINADNFGIIVSLFVLVFLLSIQGLVRCVWILYNMFILANENKVT